MEERLAYINRKLIFEYIPLIVIFVILGIVGILGNAITIVFYGFRTKRKSSTVVFITIIAVLDFVSSALMATTIADLIYNVYYSNKALCKMMYFTNETFIISSALVLWIISVDRYLKLCRPHGAQFSERSAKVCGIVLFVIAMTMASQSFVSMDIVIRVITVGNETVNVSDCANTESEDLNTVVTLTHCIDFIALAIILITFTFTYGNIQRTLRKHNQAAKESGVLKSSIKQKAFSKSNLFVSDVSKNDESTDNYTTSEPNDKSSSTDDLSKTNKILFQSRVNTTYMGQVGYAGNPSSNSESRITSNSEAASQAPLYKKKSPLSSGKTETTITVMMFAVSVGLCICFLPYIVWNTIIAVNPDMSKLELDPGIQFVLRSPFLNGVINPFIFCIFNPQYRNYVIGIFKGGASSNDSYNLR